VPGLLIRWVISAFALWLTSELVGGISVDSPFTLFVAALVLGILNAVIRPVLLILTLPINLVTLGFFTLIINGAMLKLAAGLVSGFRVEGFWAAVGGALLLSVFSFLLNLFVSDRGRIEYVYVERR
jgi:putative membrane protein